jgi:EmrB/QacA subfamily drug resistance transporter
MASSVNIALPSIGREFAMSAVSLSWVATSYLLAAAVFLVPMGRIADIYGRKRVFLYGVVIYTVSSLILPMSTSGTMLISLRVVQGIGASMIFGTSIAILTSVFPVGERGRALGINVATVYAGLSLGPFLGGLLTEHFQWRSIFLANVPLGLIIIVFVLWKLKGDWAEARGEKFDVTGSIIYGVTLVTVMYGLSLLPDILGGWLILIGVLGLFAFIRYEMKAKSPVLDVNLFASSRVFAFSNLAALINYSATWAVSFLLSLYLQYVRGLSPQNAGFVLVSQPLVMAAFSPFAGRLSDKLEPRILASVGMALSAIALLLLALLDEETAFGFIIASLAIAGLGLALFSSPNTNAIMSSVETKFYGVASGTVGTMRLIGQMLSMGISMLLIALYVGRVEITPEYYPLFLKSAKVAFVIFAALCFGGVFASLARGKLR